MDATLFWTLGTGHGDSDGDSSVYAKKMAEHPERSKEAPKTGLDLVIGGVRR